MLPLTDGAGYKLVGVKMIEPHRASMRLFFYLKTSLRGHMNVVEGCFYHVKDEFFDKFRDCGLMWNKEDGRFRPHYLVVCDAECPDLYWMVPVSSKVEKYRAIYEKMIEKYHRCTKIVFGTCDGKEAAFLIQNAFPVTLEYMDHIHMSNGKPVGMHESTARIIASYLRSNLEMRKRGIELFYTDIDKIKSCLKVST